MKNIKEKLKNNKLLITIMGIYLVFMIFSIGYFMVIKQFRNALMSLVFIVFIPLFFIIESLLKISFGPLFVLIVLLLCSGGILGACYDFYHLIPFFDDILHTIAGFIFACLGYVLVKVFFNEDNTKRKFYGSIIFGAIFSLAIGLLWELFEYLLNATMGFDMLADTYVNGFTSYLLSGTHYVYESIQDITMTLIYYGDNQVLELNGYLDLGGLDSMNDMLVCLIGSLIFVVITIFSYFKCPIINKALLPKLKCVDD